MKVATIVGARPQFIKCGPISKKLRRVATEVLIQSNPTFLRTLCRAATSGAIRKPKLLRCPRYRDLVPRRLGH
jgi:hypothetical protein